jgi:hypothetical protein
MRKLEQMLLLKRLLSNLIDFVLYILVLLTFVKFIGSEINTEENGYLFLISFFIIFFIPITTKNSTIGKLIFKLSWPKNQETKTKLIFKYLLYFVILTPSLSLSTALISFLNQSTIFNIDLTFSLKCMIAFFISDFTVFILSLGRFHIIDYILNLELNKVKFQNGKFVSLGILYLFFGTLFLLHILQYKFNLEFSKVSNSLLSPLYKEQYPSDDFNGAAVFTIRKKTENVLIPSEPLSFLYKKEYEQKTLYLIVPDKIFDSEYERKNLCIKLIRRSNINNVFSRSIPSQTKIVLSQIKQGFFLECYNNFYIYYYDNNLPEWGIYGGIKIDSSTTNDYVSFINKYKSDNVESIERKLNLSWKEILKKCKQDTNFDNYVNSLWSSKFGTETYTNKLILKLDSAELKLLKINFSSTQYFSNVNFNLPLTNAVQVVNMANLIGDSQIEYDDNVATIIFLRNEITDIEL